MTEIQTKNQNLIEQFFASLNAEDLEAVRSLLTEDAAWIPMARDMPGAGEYRGRDVIVDGFLRPIRALFADGSPSNQIVSMAATDTLVLTETHGTGHLQDGRPYDNRYAWAFEIRDGHIAEIREYLDSYYIVRLFAPG